MHALVQLMQPELVENSMNKPNVSRKPSVNTDNEHVQSTFAPPHLNIRLKNTGVMHICFGGLVFGWYLSVTLNIC